MNASAPLFLAAIGIAAVGVAAASTGSASPESLLIEPGPADWADNLGAFLRVIRQGESGDDYAALVGGGRFSNFSDHPAATGEFAGIIRRDGRRSTAAGAYQITLTTWLDLGGTDYFGDFAPASQDRAAVALLVRRGAYDDVLSGRVSRAVDRLRDEWEIFETERFDSRNVVGMFIRNGGILA